MLKSILITSLFLFSLTFFAVSQNTVGVISNTTASLDGYTFFSPFSSTKAFIVDNCGNLVNEWDRGTRPGLAAYFLDNGLMLRTYKVNPAGPFTSASNAGGLELVDWDNNTVWRYEINTTEWLSHHDAVMIPNGNILVLTWQLVYRNELVELGRNPQEIAAQNFMWSERIIELKPIGSNDAEIVWEWHIKDHYIQDFDQSKEGFGVVNDHLELFDINLPELNSPNSNSTRDWNHFNAIDYHPGLDQILISVRNSDEIWILDHSTTTEEAAGHTGGIYGKGGDILYRWGNASAYKRAPITDQKLFGQHGVNWVREGLDDEGKIMIYNNGNGRPGIDFSTVEILTPPSTSPGHYTIPQIDPIGPQNAEVIFGNFAEERFYSPYLSNALRLSNGNTQINAGSPGYIFEINPQREIVWEYIIPLSGDFPVSQGQNISNNGNFRAYKFAPDFPGFEGIDLEAGLPIENNPTPCETTVSITEESINEHSISYLPIERKISLNGSFTGPKTLIISDLTGNLRFSKQIQYHENEWDISPFAMGIYLVVIESKDGLRISKKILLY